jgi:hypothetical protein
MCAWIIRKNVELAHQKQNFRNTGIKELRRRPDCIILNESLNNLKARSDLGKYIPAHCSG